MRLLVSVRSAAEVAAAVQGGAEIIDAKDLATHRVLFGKVTGLRIGDNLRPLIYHNRGYHVL